MSSLADTRPEIPPMQYQHLLVPVDLTQPDQIAIQVAADLARVHAARMTLLHIIECIDETAKADDQTFYQQLESSIRENQRALTGLPRDIREAVHTEIVVGRRARDIVRYPTLHSVDLIVMRSDRVTPDEPRAAVAKISHHVSMFSQCPVLLVKQEATL